MEFKIILGIILAGIFTNNYALLHFLGTGAVLENERPTKRSLTLGLGTTLVMVLTTLITWPLNRKSSGMNMGCLLQRERK